MKQLRFLSTTTSRLLALLVVLAVAFVTSCKDEDDPEPIAVQFTAGTLTVGEEAGPQTIQLSLSGAAFNDGKITVTGSAAGIATFPAEVSITAGSTSAQFQLIPINNTTIDGPKSLTLTLGTGDSGFVLGAQTTLTINVTDDEGVAQVNFKTDKGSVEEGAANGIVVEIPLSSPADAAGTVEVTYTAANTAFTTVPASVAGKITIPVAVGATSANFTVLPTVNSGLDNYDVNFTLATATGGVEKGAALAYKLSIITKIVPVTIASVRALYTANDVKIEEAKYIKGVVTSVSGTTANVHQNGAYVQDASGAILVYFAGEHAFKRGEEIQVNLNGSTLKRFNGLLEADQAVVANAKKVADGTLPTSQKITIDQLNSGEFESKLVSIENVVFDAADGEATLSGTKVISVGGKTANVFTRTQASFKDEKLPLGKGTVTGIASTFNAIQLLPQVFASDIFASNPTGSITVTQTLTDFGSVSKGAVSASQNYTVVGTGLENDVIITASAGFTIANTDAGPYSSEITMPSAIVNGTYTIYVKFAPATGSDQVVKGTITHKSKGALTKEFEVTGTETGNGASALQTIALWTFETSKPNGAGTAAAATITGILAEEGSQANTAQASGVHASASTVYSNPAGNASAESFSSNFWAIDDYYQFALNTTGLKDIKISWDQTRSSTGPENFKLQYSTNGTSFMDVATTYAVVASSGTNITFSDGTTGSSWVGTKTATNTTLTYDLSSVTTLNNAATVVFRLTCTSAPGGTGGTNRVDNVKVEGR